MCLTAWNFRVQKARGPHRRPRNGRVQCQFFADLRASSPLWPGGPERVIPCRVLWRGFAVDAITWGATCGGVMWGWSGVVRRFATGGGGGVGAWRVGMTFAGLWVGGVSGVRGEVSSIERGWRWAVIWTVQRRLLRSVGVMGRCCHHRSRVVLLTGAAPRRGGGYGGVTRGVVTRGVVTRGASRTRGEEGEVFDVSRSLAAAEDGGAGGVEHLNAEGGHGGEDALQDGFRIGFGQGCRLRGPRSGAS